MKRLNLILLFLISYNAFAFEFTENQGQWNRQALYKAVFNGGNVFLLNDGFLFTIYDSKQLDKIHHSGFQNHFNDKVKCHSYKITFSGALQPQIISAQKKASFKNYFTNADQSKWKANASSFSEITYKNLYSNIDLKVYSHNGDFKYDFILNPGADVSQIKMKVQGVDEIIMQNHSLIYVTSLASIRENIPIAYLETANQKQRIDCNYFMSKKNVVGFHLPNKNSQTTNYKIVIDPVLLISTYSGSSGTTYGSSATYDSQGNLFIGAMLFDTGWPYTLGAYDITFAGGIDIGISKFDSTGANQIWATYIGGNSGDVVLSMIANQADELFVFAHTGGGYPVTAGAYDMSYNGGGYDIAISKLSQNGSSLLGSTYIGGNDDDGRSLYLSMNVHSFGDMDKGEIQLDANQNPVIASMTRSANFPVTAGAYQTAAGGNIDACLFKLNSSLTQIIFSTRLGGVDDEAAYGMCLDASGNYILTGGTNSNNFPVTAGAYQQNYAGGFSYQYDSFISIIDATGSNLSASTYFGYNNGKDKGYKTAVDTAGFIYVFGNSEGTLPVSAGVFSNQNRGNYVLKFNTALTNLLLCTSYGDGSNAVNLQPIAFYIDGCNQIYCAAFTSSVLGSPNVFPLTANAQQSMYDLQDVHVMVFAPDFASMVYGSYLGGAVREHTDAGSSRFDNNGVLYLGVCTQESFAGGFPVTPNAFCPSSQTPDWDMAGVKWDLEGCPLVNGAAPVVAFSSDDSSYCGEHCFSFFDLSTNNPTQWAWSFQGATPDTSNEQHPDSICYFQSGTYPVTLVASNQSGSGSVIYTGFITIYSAPSFPFITVAGDTLISTPAYAYQWYLNNILIAGATNQFYIPSIAGSYSVVIFDSSGCSSVSSAFFFTSVNYLFNPGQLIIFPNPVSEQLTISISETLKLENIEVYNTMSQLIYTSSFFHNNSTNVIVIYVNDWNKGLYNIRITDKNKKQYSKVITKI